MMPLWTTATSLGGVRMGVVVGRRAMRRPAGMRDADRAGQRMRRELAREVVELALGAPPLDRAVDDRWRCRAES